MNNVIEEYYKQANVMPFILNQKMSKLQRNTDIQKEFEYWIQHKDYKKDVCVSVNGYTAEKLAALSEYMDGEGSFMLLIELRESPDKALSRISNGFKIK